MFNQRTYVKGQHGRRDMDPKPRGWKRARERRWQERGVARLSMGGCLGAAQGGLWVGVDGGWGLRWGCRAWQPTYTWDWDAFGVRGLSSRSEEQQERKPISGCEALGRDWEWGSEKKWVYGEGDGKRGRRFWDQATENEVRLFRDGTENLRISISWYDRYL